MAERYHLRFFDMVPLPEGTTLENATPRIAGFNVAGPKSRALLSALTDADLSAEGWRFMRSRTIRVAGIDCLAIRVSFTGDLGWELHCAESDQPALYGALLEAASSHGGGPVGSRALGALRVEKGYGSWGREYSPEYWPGAGLHRLIKLDKEFLNKDAYMKINHAAAGLTCSRSIPAMMPTPMVVSRSSLPTTPVGRVTSGAFGYTVGKSLAIGYAREGTVAAGDEVDIFILGRPHRATVLAEPPFDAAGARLRA